MSTSYRPDIDGLRAVAVLMVLFFHAGISGIPGGFVGVDVFFVISGFLITRIVDRECQQREFTYTSFYRRRILRIMPALFLIAWVTTALCAFILLPSDFASYGKSLLAVTFSVANVFFWRENGGYFAQNAQEVPLLHAWSLSVEEQYYLVWPLCVALGSRFLSRRALLGLTVALIVVSVGLAEWLPEFTLGAAYYLLPTRMYELLIGSLLALAWDALPDGAPRRNAVLSLGGLAAVLWSAVSLTEADRFPGVVALVPTLGAGALILSGKGAPGVVNRALALRPMVFIGLISYSLYLWHWPVLVLVRYTGQTLSPAISALCVGLSVACAWVSWRLVETPARHQPRLSFGQVATRFFVVPAGATAVLGAVIWLTGGIPGRFPANVQSMDAALNTRPDEIRGTCHASVRTSDVPPTDDCRFGAPGTPPRTAFMVGDSHANHFTGFVGAMAERAALSVVDYTMDACIPVAGRGWGERPYFAERCATRNRLALEHISARHFSYVILAGRWPSVGRPGVEPQGPPGPPLLWQGTTVVTDRGVYRREFVDGLRQELRVITDSGAIPVVVKDSAPTRSSPKCPIIRTLFAPSLDCSLPTSAIAGLDGMIDAALAELRPEYPQLIVVDPKRIMCGSAKCESDLAGVPLYRDGAHLNDAGSRTLGATYADRIGNPFTPGTTDTTKSGQVDTAIAGSAFGRPIRPRARRRRRPRPTRPARSGSRRE
jgi:peptidoglycan/LPS O-acetylase OafA/YrhL